MTWGQGEPAGSTESSEVSDVSEVSEAPDFDIVTEEELAPALDSNRQPLGPDPLEWPQWSAAEVEAMRAGRPVNLGGGLWSPERFPLQPVPALSVAAAPPAERARLGGVLERDSLDRYLASRAWCVDPQLLLPDWRRTRLEAHLEAHATTAVHPVRVWLLAPGQAVAPEVEAEWLHQSSFGPNAPGVLAILVIDHPDRGRWIGPPGLSGAEISGLRPASAGDAGGDAAAGSLEAQVVRLVLEAYDLPAPRAAGTAVRSAVDAALASERTTARQPVAAWLAAASAVLALIAAVVFRRRPQAASSQPCLWLETDRPTRLGGPHGGGAGASLEW